MAEETKIFELSPDGKYDDRNAYVPAGQTRNVIYPEYIYVVDHRALIMKNATISFEGYIDNVLVWDNAVICGTMINLNPNPDMTMYIGSNVEIKSDAQIIGFTIVKFVEDAGAIKNNTDLPDGIKKILLGKD